MLGHQHHHSHMPVHPGADTRAKGMYVAVP